MLKQAVEEYVALRRATGFKFVDSEQMLRSYLIFASERGDEVIRSDTVVSWAAQAEGQHRRYMRFQVVRRFAEFARAEDPRHDLPPQDVFCANAVRPSPHVFSDQDIANIVAHASELGPVGSLRPQTYSTIFGLMAVTGLRRGEALGLRIKDFTDDGLVIRQTKFRKNRFVPLHETAVAALERYLTSRRRVPSHTDHLFVSLRLRELSPGTLLRTFQAVCDQAGVGRTAGGAKPRLLDLRHSFAVHALERCPTGRDQVNRHVLALATYMGHASIESTYWYLEQTPRLLRDIASACECFATGELS